MRPGLIFLPILSKRTPRFREVTQLTQGHRSRKWHSRDLIPNVAVTTALRDCSGPGLPLQCPWRLLTYVCTFSKVETKNLICSPQREQKGGGSLLLCKAERWGLGGSGCKRDDELTPVVFVSTPPAGTSTQILCEKPPSILDSHASVWLTPLGPS